jgi:hypothetical protein
MEEQLAQAAKKLEHTETKVAPTINTASSSTAK